MFINLPMIDYFFPIFIILINFCAFYYYVKRKPKDHFFILPFTYFILYYLLNYPIKAALLLFLPINITKMEMFFNIDYDMYLGALVYSTIFFIIFVLSAVHLMHKMIQIKKFPNDYRTYINKNINSIEKIAKILFFIGIVTFIFKLSSNIFYGFAPNRKFSIIEIVFANLSSFVPLTLLLLLLVHHEKPCKKNKIYVFVIIIGILVEMLFTTSKAPIFILVGLYFLYKEIIDEKPKLIYLIGSIPIIYFVFYYSYFFRYSGLVFHVINYKIVESVITNSFYEFSTTYNIVLPALFNRLELFDNLIYTILRAGIIDKGYFILGSSVEVFNIIPRFIWNSKPFMDFSYYIVNSILGLTYNNSSGSIGRIGESYFILKQYGIILAPVYALVFSWMYKTLLFRRITIFKVILYFFLIFAYIIWDNYMFQSFASIIYLSIILYIICIILLKHAKR